MAEAAAAFVVQGLALKGAEAAVVAAIVEVAVTAAAYAGAAAITRQNSKEKEQGGLIDLQLNSAAPRQMVIGKRMTGGVLIDWYLAGSNNTKLYLPVYLSEGPCGQVTRVFADGREVWATPLVHGTRTTIPDFRSGGDRLWLTYYDGRVGQTADATLVALGQGWTSANKMTGCAWVLIECQWDSDNMRSPPSLSFEMEGAKLYDRRKDTTAGGSGSHRANDPATWEFSDNPAVALDHFMLGRYWSGARTFGIGLSADEVPYSYFAAQANVCDEDVDLNAGGTQKRYRANGFIFANEDYAATITKLCTAMAARPADFGGRFGVIGVESKTPVMTIDDGDLIAGVNEVYTPKRSWAALVGEVEGRFQDPAQLYQPTPYPNVTDATWEAEDGGEPKLITHDLEFETHVERAQRLALLKARAERRQATLRGVYPLWTVELERGDWFVRTGAKWGEDGKTFEVIERVLDPASYTVTIVSQEVDAADSAWDESTAADGPPAPLDPTDTLSAVAAPSLTVTSNPIVGAASNTPAIKIAFTNPTDPRVHTMFVEVYRDSDALKVATVPVTIPDADGEVIIQNGIADGVLYDVRAKYLTPGLSSAWSTVVSVTTGATYAVGEADSVAWGNVTDDGGRPDNNADVTSANTAAGITGQGALATLSAVGASNLLAGVGKNGLVDTEFRFSETYWTKLTSSGSVALTTATSTNGIRRAVLTGTGATIGQYIQWSSQAQWDAFPVAAGEYVEASAYLGGSNVSEVNIFIDFRDASGVNIGYSAQVSDASPSAGNGELSTFERLTIIAQAPANTVKARLAVRGIASSSAPVLNVAKPYFGKANSAQTEATPWNPGFDGEPGANITETRTAAAILSQGAFATLSSAAYGSGLLTGFGSLAALAFTTLGTNVRRADGVTALTDALAVTSLGTAASITGQGAFATISTAAYGSGLLTGFGSLAALAFATLGTNVRRADATTVVTDALAITSLGTAAAITSQGALATLAQVNLGASGRVYRDDGTTRLTDALAVTALGTAAAFTGQGALATLSTINSSGLVGAGVITFSALASTAVRLGTNITRNDGTTSLTDALAVTSLGTAAAIASQGALATLGQVNLGASGRVYRDDGSTRVTDALAITSLGTASAIASQGAFATLNTVNSSALIGAGVVIHTALASTAVRLGTNITRADGSTSLTDALAVTSLGTAAAITGQGALATKATIDSSALVGSGVITFSALASTAVRLGTNITRNDGTTSLTDALAVTSLGTAAAISGQGSLATISRANVVSLSGSEAINNAILTPQIDSLQSTVMPDRVAVAEDFTSSHGATGTPATFAAIAVGSVANVANEGSVRLFTDLQTFSTRGWLPVRSDKTYRLTVRAAVTVDGTDNRTYAAFSLHAADGTWLTTANFTALEDLHTVADGWITRTLNVTGATLIAAAATAAWVRPRLSVNRNAASTDSGSETQVSILKLEMLTRLNDGSLVREDGSTALTDANVVTSLGTASAITGQGGLATKSAVDLSTTEVTNKSLTAVDLAAATKLGTIETNADVTADNTAAAITSQGGLATLSFATLGTNVRLADGTTSATNALLVTSLGTASAITSQGALATLSSVTGARLAAGVGRNALIDPEFRMTTSYWTPLTSAGSVAMTVATSTNGIRRAVLTGTGVTVGQYLQLASTPQIDSFPIAAGEWLEASVYLGGSNLSQVQLFIEWRNASNTTVSFSTAVTDASPTAGNGDLSTFERLTTILQAPANTVKARVFVRGIASTTSPILNVSKPFMAKAQAGQTEATPWNPGFDGEPGANVTETRTAAGITSQGSLATLSFATLGTNVRRADGTTVATEAAVVTSLGTASAISGQGGLATLSFVTIATNLRLADGTTVATTAMVVTASGTAAGIASQGNQATANAARGNTASRPATTGGWGWYSNTETGTLQLDVDGTGWVDVASLSSPLTISRTNGFVKTKIGSGTNTSDSVSFSGSGGSGSGYTFAHELIVTYTTGPTPTVSSASGSPITVSATGGVAGDEARGFVITIVTDSLGGKEQLISPVALFWET